MTIMLDVAYAEWKDHDAMERNGMEWEVSWDENRLKIIKFRI
jgi:hypothetical protein